MVELFANSGAPDLTPRSAVSDLGLHCLPVTHLGVSSLQWDNTQTLDENPITIPSKQRKTFYLRGRVNK